MKVALVSTYTHPIALGLRYLSSYLKSAGHEAEMIFMGSRRDTTRADFSAAALDAFIEHVRASDLIGMSLMTNSFHRARALTERIRAVGIKTPIVWGGTHPTVAPDESLEVADLICVGEGEEPLLRLIERLEENRDPKDLPSFGFRGGGPFGNTQTFRNPVRPLDHDLDDIPFPDYDLETHWVADKDGLAPARPDNLRGALHTLRVLTSRGCPYKCTFCNNTALHELYRGKGKLVRLRSADNVLAEIRQALACFPTIETVNFVDDLFFVRSEEEIEEFAAKYNAQVALPLQMDAFPNTVSERKVRALAKVPIELISMGIESASADTLENLYLRPTPPKRIADAIATFKKHRVCTEYHYIVSNPYEPEKNVIETMRFIADHHRGPSVLRVFPLMFYPGTPLHGRALKDGLIGQRDDGAYDYMGTGALQFARHDYLAIWLRTVLKLRDLGVPPWMAHRIIDFATSRPTRALLDRKWFCPTVFFGYQLTRKIVRNFVYQPFIRPFKYLRRKPRYRERHPEDEATLPRNNLATDSAEPAGRRRKPDPCRPTARWRVPEINRHARHCRETEPKSDSRASTAGRDATPLPVVDAN
jgi:radical SAM superfamily enzyme YgiQ (UPF0313 family)